MSQDPPPTEVSAVGESLLLTVTGRDHPGVTQALFEALARHPLVVVDIEQVVIRGQLILGVLVAAGHGSSVDLSGIERAAREPMESMGMELATSPGGIPGGAAAPAPAARLHVTLLGAPLAPAAVAAMAGCIASVGGNIERIDRLASYPVTAIELMVSRASPDRLRVLLSEEAVRLGVDVAVQPAGLHRRAKRLVVLDVDSTLIQGEVIEMLARRAGCEDEVAEVTRAAMAGDLEFEESLRRRVKLLAGLPESVLPEVRRSVQLAPGARTLVRTLKRLGYRVAIVSGGFSQITDPLAAELGLDYSQANLLEVRDGRLTGEVSGVVVDRAEKAAALERFAAAAGVPLAQTVAIGDGANDLDMLARAGLGIAFNGKPVLREAADMSVTVPYLDAVLFLLGVTREEIEAADAETGDSLLG
ncbi:MAG TPA: phosphoserine phosphatase SerB [Actinomycetes bacterium]|nr:phosphoserine phosphatase SerB [Actinomycetes bacterium]